MTMLRRHIRLITPWLALSTSMLYSSNAFSGDAQLENLRHMSTVERFIVKYRDDGSAHARAGVLRDTLRMSTAAVPAAADKRPLELTHLRRTALGAEIIQASRPLSRMDAETVMRQLASDPAVGYVEADALLQAVAVPAEAYFHENQWPLDDFNDGHINIHPAWQISRGSGIVISIIDTGITAHPNLNANILPGYDFISDPEIAQDGDGRDADPTQNVNYADWHGTYVTGVVVADAQNSAGISGVAPEAKVVPIRVLGKQGGWMSDVLDAIVWAAGGDVDGVPKNPHPAEVINLSLGENGGCTVAMQTAIDTATSLGSVVVTAAGNNSNNVSTFMPANCQNVITVGGSDAYGWWYANSNYGDGITVYAPGSWVFSTTNSGLKLPADPYYAYQSGTSMAAPHVAGVIALMQSAADMPLTPAQIREILHGTGRLSAAGLNLVDAGAAVQAVQAASVPDENFLLEAGFTFTVDGLSVAFTDQSQNAGGQIASWQWNFGDGTSSWENHPRKTYAAAGTYAVTLTVIDDRGAKDVRSLPVTVAVANNKLVADFSFEVDQRLVRFTDASFIQEGNVVARMWNFGDGALSSEQHPVKRYAADGAYTVMLTAYDGRGGTSVKSETVFVQEAAHEEAL